MGITLDVAREKIREGKFMERDLEQIVKVGIICKKENKLRTVFNNILGIRTYLCNKIKRNPRYFVMNSSAVCNIEIGTLFHGSCTYDYSVPPPPAPKMKKARSTQWFW